MKINYDFALKEVLKSEGGYTNDPSDSGGPTNYGITLADYRLYIKKSGTATDVKNMTLDQAKTIYKSKYWDALGCDDLDNGVDYTVFDYGVNSGLQRPRNDLKKFKDKKGADLINAINDERQAFLTNLSISRPKDKKFIKGWTDRVSRVRKDSLNLNKSVAAPAASAFVGAAAIGGTAMATTPQHYWPWVLGAVGIVGAVSLITHIAHESKKP